MQACSNGLKQRRFLARNRSDGRMDRKTIAVILSCDTKYREAEFIRIKLRDMGMEPLVINTATGNHRSRFYDISSEEVLAYGGFTWETMVEDSKSEKIAKMTAAVSAYVEQLYRLGKIQGVLSVGGLQNTVMATSAMKRLPLGFPKVMATTVASGSKTFESVAGDKDIVMLPSICDFSGLNMVTQRIMENACACCAGMVRYAGGTVKKRRRPVVGVTLMGITNTGACAAIEELEQLGMEVLGFHATGCGGIKMEEMAEEGLIDGILDMNLHEITSGFFGGGFSFGKNWEKRLRGAVKSRIPLVVCPGGLDFVDFPVNELPDRMDQRKVLLHNPDIAHIKILKDEAKQVAGLVSERLSRVDYPVKFLFPTEGMRSNTREGQALYDKETDLVLIKSILNSLNDHIERVCIPGNLDTKEWGIQAAHYMAEELEQNSVRRI